MVPDPFTDALTAALLGDDDCADLLSADRFVARMVKVEAALAECQASLGIIPQEAAGAIVRHLVSEMDGEVVAESKLGKGTTIRFTLPEAQ